MIIRGWSNPGTSVPGIVLSSGILLWLLARQLRLGVLPSAEVGAVALVCLSVLIHGLLRFRHRSQGDLAWKVGPKGMTVTGAVRESTWSWAEVNRVVVYPRRFSRWAWVQVRPRILVIALGSPAIYLRKRDVDLATLEAALARWTTVSRSWL